MKIAIISLLAIAASSGFCADPPVSGTRYIPSQNGFALDYGKRGPGDVLILKVYPDSGCTITQSVKNPTPLGWVSGFTLTIPDKAAGVHTGTFGGTYGCGSSGSGKPPEWNGSAKVDACKEVKDGGALPFTIDITDEKLAKLKQFQDWLKKFKYIKKADATISIGGSRYKGSECCEKRSDRTDFYEYDGTGTGSLGVILAYGVPGLALPKFKIPVPGPNDVELRAVLDVSISGGGDLAITGSVGGRFGECSCAKVGWSVTGKPGFKAVASGVAGAALVDDETGEEVDSSNGLEITGSLESGVETGADGTHFFGSNCAPDEVKGSITLPDLTISFTVNLFWLVNFNFSKDLTEYIYEPAGIQQKVNFP